MIAPYIYNAVEICWLCQIVDASSFHLKVMNCLGCVIVNMLASRVADAGFEEWNCIGYVMVSMLVSTESSAVDCGFDLPNSTIKMHFTVLV